MWVAGRAKSDSVAILCGEWEAKSVLRIKLWESRHFNGGVFFFGGVLFALLNGKAQIPDLCGGIAQEKATL